MAALALLACGWAGCTTHTSPFERTDADGDSRLEVPELEAALAEMVHRTGDLDGDGNMTFAEWKRVYPKADRRSFERYDANGSGGLTLGETKVAIDREKVFDKLLSKIDVNADGVIDKTEAATFHDAMQAADGANDVQKLETILNS
jgi:Ca2+-binding EF-hand superfamily protein